MTFSQSFHGEQVALDGTLGLAVISTLPPDWGSCFLHAEAAQEVGSASLAISLRNPEGHGLALVTDGLAVAVRDLFSLYERHGHSLHSVDYSFTRRINGKWSFEAQYGYR